MISVHMNKGKWLGTLYTIHGSYGLGRVPRNLGNSGVNTNNHSRFNTPNSVAAGADINLSLQLLLVTG